MSFITIVILVAVVVIGFRLLMGKAIKDRCGNATHWLLSRLSPTQESPAHCWSNSARWRWNDHIKFDDHERLGGRKSNWASGACSSG